MQEKEAKIQRHTDAQLKVEEKKMQELNQSHFIEIQEMIVARACS